MMNRAPDGVSHSPERLLTMASGGWVLALAGALCLSALVWRTADLWRGRASRAVGDGRNVASYGFNLSPSLVPVAAIVAGGVPKNGIPALDNPRMMPAGDVAALNQRLRDQHRGKYLVPTDRVVGLAVGSETRAYPLRVLAWHEVIDDVIEGVPVAVTYNPLCDSVVVFDRRVGDAMLAFSVSGLLYNSNLLMFDRQVESRAESLWSQLQGRAVTGPAAERGLTLRVLPAAVLCWEDWLRRFPQTAVLSPDTHLLERYRREPFVSYFGSDELRFPVDPLLSLAAGPRKAPLIVLGCGGQRRALRIADLVRSADPEGINKVVVGGRTMRLQCRSDPLTAFLADPAPDQTVEVIYAFHFAWHAQHPESRVVDAAEP
jgi:hypothetical protein